MTKSQTKQVPFIFNRGGYYYFGRRVPTDLGEHYVYPRVLQSLKTKTPQWTCRLLCRPKCSFKPLFARKRPGFSSPMLSAAYADCRSH